MSDDDIKPFGPGIFKIDVQPGPGCVDCAFQGTVIWFTPRPNGPPGNQIIACPACSSAKPSEAD